MVRRADAPKNKVGFFSFIVIAMIDVTEVVGCSYKPAHTKTPPDGVVFVYWFRGTSPPKPPNIKTRNARENGNVREKNGINKSENDTERT